MRDRPGHSRGQLVDQGLDLAERRLDPGPQIRQSSFDRGRLYRGHLLAEINEEIVNRLTQPLGMDALDLGCHVHQCLLGLAGHRSQRQGFDLLQQGLLEVDQ